MEAAVGMFLQSSQTCGLIKGHESFTQTGVLTYKNVMMFIVILHVGMFCFPLVSNIGFWRGTPGFMWSFLLLGEATKFRMSISNNDLNTEE